MTSIRIEIPALDTHSDWFDDYVSAVEAESGFSWTGDDSMYGVFSDDAGNRYQAYVNPALSDEENWVVEFDEVD